MRGAPQPTPPEQAAAAVAAIAAATPAKQLPFLGITNTPRKIELRNYQTSETITIAEAPDICQLQPAALAAVEAMQRARARAKAMLKKESQDATTKPARRSAAVDSKSHRPPHRNQSQHGRSESPCSSP